MRQNEEYCYIYKDGTWDNFTSAVSSNESVAVAAIYDSGETIGVDPIGSGTCTISITDENNKKKNVTFTVSDSWEISRIAYETTVNNCWYGTKKLVVDTLPNCSGTIKIKKDTYKFKVGRSGSKTVKLKKVYKLNQKVKITIKKGKLQCVLNKKLESFTFKTKKEVRKDGEKITVTIKNSSKKLLGSHQFVLAAGVDDIYEDEDLDD